MGFPGIQGAGVPIGGTNRLGTRRIKGITRGNKMCKRVLITDVDGCLTDGSVYVDENGVETRKFSTYDSIMFDYWDYVYWITRETNTASKKRFEKLNKGNGWYHYGTENRLELYKTIEKERVGMEIDYIGDSLDDMGVFRYRARKNLDSFVPINSLFLFSNLRDDLIGLHRPIIVNLLHNRGLI
jgi:DNA-directed RNA polymerase subunit N (RpoN/RPB10)